MPGYTMSHSWWKSNYHWAIWEESLHVPRANGSWWNLNCTSFGTAARANNIRLSCSKLQTCCKILGGSECVLYILFFVFTFNKWIMFTNMFFGIDTFTCEGPVSNLLLQNSWNWNKTLCPPELDRTVWDPCMPLHGIDVLPLPCLDLQDIWKYKHKRAYPY